MILDGGKISLWDIRSGEATHSVRAHQEAVTGLKVSMTIILDSGVTR